MRKQIFSLLFMAATLGLTSPAARAYDAPWSSLNFFQDQTWSQINNRITDQNTAAMNKSVHKSQQRRAATEATAQAEAQAQAARRAVLDLGAAASTDLTPLRPYLAETQLTETQARTLLATYAQVAASLDVPANDSASGIAAFLAGSYAAYSGQPFPDAYYKPLYEQFASSMGADGALTQMPLEQRIEYYQRLVVVGMVFQLAQLETPPAEIPTLRAAAASAFTDIAGISPERIRFTASGLTVD